jgi:hypothetical protein
MRVRLGSHCEELPLAPLPSPLTRLFPYYFYESKIKSRKEAHQMCFSRCRHFKTRLPSRGHKIYIVHGLKSIVHGPKGAFRAGGHFLCCFFAKTNI